MLRVDARVAGIAYSGTPFRRGRVRLVRPPAVPRIQGGYRHIDLKIDKDDTLASFKLSGPYIGRQCSF